MKSSRFIFILFLIGTFFKNTISENDKCIGRWQIADSLNIKAIFNWRIVPKMNLLVVEFRTNLVEKGYWYGFSISSSSDEPTNERVYTLQWKENDTNISWDVYNVSKKTVSIITEHQNLSLIEFQRASLSGLLTVYTTLNLSSLRSDRHCLYFVYMRGRFQAQLPLIPNEIRFNKSFCLACVAIDLTSTNTYPTTIDETTNQLDFDLKSLSQNVSVGSLSETTPTYSRNEHQFIWFGRIVNRTWTNDYYNLSSLASQHLRLDLQNLFLFLINHNSSYSFICNQFDLYSLRSGSILFASNITLISNISKNQTINTVENLIKSVNYSKDFHLNFDFNAHHVKSINEMSYIDKLFKNFSRTVVYNRTRRAELDVAYHLLVGCIFGFACFMIIITSILCLYGYYKCRRRQFRLFTERQTLKFKHDLDSYKWLGQEPSISSSSPYLIQSTSI